MSVVQSAGTEHRDRKARTRRSPTRLIPWGGFLAICLGVACSKSPPAKEQAESSSPIVEAPGRAVHEETPPATKSVPQQKLSVAAPTTAQSSEPRPPLALDTPSRELVSSLARSDQASGAMTPEDVNAWKANLQKLIQQGPQSVPAIAEFLDKNQDTEFGAAGKSSLGYSSARRAMFDALAQIGGAEATGVLTRVLKDSADPREIAALADRLAGLSPEDHKAEIIQASREMLGMAASGKLPADTDVGPIFEVLQKYGDQTVLEDLEKGSQQWKYYSAIALGSLPDGAGVPSLIKMASEDTGGKIPALQILGQLAYDHPEARAALLQQARESKIPANYWPYLIDSLAGREFGYLNSDNGQTRASNLASDLKSTSIKFGNQNYFTIPNPASTTPEFIEQRTAIINEIKAVTSDPAALSALEQAQKDLTSRPAQQANK